jgi:glycine betaine/proline transport system substrate-binding protein
MLMAWLPLTHKNYWEKVRDKVVNLGPLYTGKLGWVVPDYIPEDEVSSIEDLKKPDVAKKIGRQIQGIDPGSGLMQASERAMQDYQLDKLKLVSASGAAMTAVLDRAYRRKHWVVVTAWQPHWIFARYKLRFLKDPKRVLGGMERIHAIARQGFGQDFPPQVTGFFTRLYLPDDELAAILLDAQENNVKDAVTRYIKQHPKRVRYWLTGKIAE